jgi:ADP-heptose:LPS heptosyltransferase
MRIFVLKPDGIGDFVLATGALRAFAREYGEEQLVICVRTLLVPLAESQFPRATVLPLPTEARRKVINLFLWNFLVCVPLWFKIRFLRIDVSVCLRGLRNYLETILFYSVPARRFVAPTNNLCIGPKKKVRATVENVVQHLFRADLQPYPEVAVDAPLEIEANRRVVSSVMNREVSIPEVLPHLQAKPIAHDGPFWMCAPITMKSKVYPLAQWAEVFRELKPEIGDKAILLIGSADQQPQLAELEALLKAEGLSNARVFIPATLVDLMNWIAAAELLLTVDTAAAHFAAALDQRSVVAFSGLHVGMFGPWQRSERQSWLLPDPPPQKKSHWPKSIPPARIAAEARRVLQLP